LQNIPPSGLPVFFKASLEPAMLVSILELFRQVGNDPGRKGVIRQYLNSFARVSRFETVVLFLSQKEKAIARDVWENLGVSKDMLEKQWSAVWG
jgi:RNA polymerase II-associated protein 3